MTRSSPTHRQHPANVNAPRDANVPRVLISEDRIARRVRQLARQIERDLAGRDLVVVAVLNGTVMFLADLIRHLSLPLRLDFVGISSYRGGTTPGRLLFATEPKLDLRGCDVLVVDDILDTGRTLAQVCRRLRGTTSNASAIGAKVHAYANLAGRGTWQMRQIAGGMADDLRAHFGLGNTTNVTTLRIEWPSGTVEEFTDVAANQILTLWEPPAVSAAMRADGACELTIKAQPNRGWQIKASSDLLTWQTLTTVTNTTFAFQFTDTAAAGMACRFYRVESE